MVEGGEIKRELERAREIELQRERERHRMNEHFHLLKCLQPLGLSQARARNPQFHPGLLCECLRPPT